MRGWVRVASITVLALAVVRPAASAPPACRPTPPDAEGPFYTPDAPARDRTGHGFVVSGVVRAAAGCAPVAGARIEWWSADPDGRYDDRHRASQRADDAGRYRYETTFPVGTRAARRISTSG